MDEDRLIKVSHADLRSVIQLEIEQSANFIRTELPVRIAHRIRDLQALQYRIVTTEGAVCTLTEVSLMPFRCSEGL